MKKTVLLVEDHDSLRQLLGAYLTRRYRVVAAKNGLEAMAWMQKGVIPDVIITDLGMPELDGWSFIAQLQHSGLFCDIPRIVITGEAAVPAGRHTAGPAIDFLLKKPFNPTVLEEKLHFLLHRDATSATLNHQ
jgi:two-component system chemotaxis response regulator CheY